MCNRSRLKNGHIRITRRYPNRSIRSHSTSHDKSKKIGVEKKTRCATVTRIKALDINRRKFQTNHEKLSSALNDSTRTYLYFTEGNYSQCEKEYDHKTIIILQELHAICGTSAGVSDHGSSSSVSRASSKISLLRFSRTSQDWHPFRGLFQAMVHRNAELSEVAFII